MKRGMSRNGDKIVVDREEMKSQKNAADWRGGGGERPTRKRVNRNQVTSESDETKGGQKKKSKWKKE